MSSATANVAGHVCCLDDDVGNCCSVERERNQFLSQSTKAHEAIGLTTYY